MCLQFTKLYRAQMLKLQLQFKKTLFKSNGFDLSTIP